MQLIFLFIGSLVLVLFHVESIECIAGPQNPEAFMTTVRIVN